MKITELFYLLLSVFIAIVFIDPADGLTNLLATRILSPNNATVDVHAELKRMQDRYSILEAISFENRTMISLPSKDGDHISNFQQDFGIEKIMCGGGNREIGQPMKTKIKSSIESALRFYGSHLGKLDMSDYAAGLSILKVVDDKHGSHFQASFPLRDWTSQICINSEPSHGTKTCHAFEEQFLERNNHWKNWSNHEVLANDSVLHSVGNDKETIWPVLNHECLEAMLIRCEIPHVCERVMFDSNPGSQYMLSHQLLHRIFAQTKMESCGFSKHLVDEQVNQQFCRKMLHETRLISDYGAAFIFRDLFAENMAFCGFIGYPNFFREDWLDMILSWQSKSDYGCFIKEHGSNFQMSDFDVPRMLTESEKRRGAESTDEICQPHFTAVSLSALAVAWDYFEDNCTN